MYLLLKAMSRVHEDTGVPMIIMMMMMRRRRRTTRIRIRIRRKKIMEFAVVFFIH